jgi:sialic acid synthase SpsE
MKLNLNKLTKPYIIAEIGCNHNGDTDLGIKMIKEAKRCGADAVKFQYFTANNLFTKNYLDKLDSGLIKIENVKSWQTPEYRLKNVRQQIAAYTNDKRQLIKFRSYCKKIDIDFGCTPVDENGVKFLKKIKSDFIKISSMDANNLPFIKTCIDTNLPIILSTGMTTLYEIDKIYNLFFDHNYKNFSLLHCISIYPPKDKIINLNFIKTLKKIYDCEIGYSDHSLGIAIPIAAVAIGCKIIEKHFTLDKNMPGWDHKISADKEELKIICKASKKVFFSLGRDYKFLSVHEIKKKIKFRRSMVAKKNLLKEHILKKSDFTFKRAGIGIPPEESLFYIGKKLSKNIKNDETINKDCFY